MGDMKKGSGVKINTTSEIPAGDVLSSTLEAYEKGWDMNHLNDPSDTLGELSGHKNLKGSGSKP